MGSRLEASSTNVSKRIEKHRFEDEQGDEYEASTFGGFADYMRRKKIKLQNLDVELRTQSRDKPAIFKGVVAHVNGYTQPSLNDLHKLIVAYGGGFLQYLDGKTVATHVIASNLTPKKKVEFARYRIAKPAWIVESVNAGKLLPWDAFRLVDEGVAQKVLAFDNGRVISQSNTQRSGYRDQTEDSWYTAQMRANTDGKTPSPTPPPTSSPEAEDVVSSSEKSHRSMVAADAADDDVITMGQRVGGDEDHTIHPEPNSHLIKSDRINSDTSVQGVKVDDQVLPEIPHLEKGLSATLVRSVDKKHIAEHPQVPQSDMSPGLSRSVADVSAELTAEEHNARLLSDPRMAKSSTANPEFLAQYYRESRLHHLSTWKAELKAQLQAMANERSSSEKSRQQRVPGARRYILHVDFDSFFAAVSLREHPRLVDKPVVIAHGSGPGSEIASCNYPARNFGVKNGMWMKAALQLCPDLKTLPYDYKAYEEASRHFYEAIIATDGLVQSVSIDEALVDVSRMCIAAGGTDGKRLSEGSLYREQATADQIATSLRGRILDKTGCHVSVGIGSNILLAKVALRKAKPAGQHQIKPDEVLDFLGRLPVQDLPGVAWSLGGKLEEIGVKYVKDIRELHKERLMGALGPKTGGRLWDYARGIDKTEVGDQVVRKSVSAEVNWGIRFVTQQQADEFVQSLCDELSRRLLEQGLKGTQMTMKIMRRATDAPLDPPKNLGHGKCDTFSKSIVLGVATNDSAVLGREAVSILKAFSFSPGELRGLGVQMQKLEPLKASGKLFSSNLESSQRRLQFKSPSSVTAPHVQSPPPSGSGKSTAPRPSLISSEMGKIKDHADPIERSPTPEPNQETEIIAGAVPRRRAASSDVPYKPLNITGTQFVLPSQIDPDVLAELPSDIRLKLAPKQKSIADTLTRHPSPAHSRSRSDSPLAVPPDLPNQSQLDPTTLNELPADVRDELLSFYQSAGSRPQSQWQHQPPNSPSSHKPTAPHTTKNVNHTPTKRQKGSTGPRGRGRPPKTNSKFSSKSTLTQSNFIAQANRKPVNGHSRPSTATHPTTNAPDQQAAENLEATEISESFLSALPADMRAEIVADQKRQRLRQRSGLDISSVRKDNRKRQQVTTLGEDTANPGAGRQRTLHLVARDPIPTFTSNKLSKIEDLRDAVGAWVDEFSTSSSTITTSSPLEPASQPDATTTATSGPYREDIEALAVYLRQVVTVEHDMEKAVAVLRWLEWKTVELEPGARYPWITVLDHLKNTVRAAVGERGVRGELNI